MSGLFEKDIRVLMKRRSYFLILLAVVAFMGANMARPFLFAYMQVVAVMLAIGTINYDDADNGMSFLMTMPVSSSSYVAEKYIISVLFSFVASVLSCVLGVVFSLIQNKPIGLDILSMSLIAIPFALIFISFALPIELKYGAEKGRMVLLVFYGIVIVIALVCGKILDSQGIDEKVILSKVQEVPEMILKLAAFVASLVVLAISYAVSNRIMGKKEY